MEFATVLARRRMVRRYTAEPVAPESIRRLLTAAVRAPSAGFTQGWDFLVLVDPTDVDLFWRVTADRARGEDSWLRQLRTAPVLILCWSDRQAYLSRYAEPDKGWADRDENRWTVPYWHVDTGMAALLMLLAAVDEGLGACFFGVPPERVDALRAAFDVPANRMPVGVVSVGHPAEDQRSRSLRRGRRPLEEVAHVGRFGVPFG